MNRVCHLRIKDGFATRIKIVEFGLGNGIIYVHGWHSKFARLGQLVQTVYPGNALLNDALDQLERCWIFL